MVLGFIFIVLLGGVENSVCFPGFRRRTVYINPSESREYSVSYNRASNWLYTSLNRCLTALAIVLSIVLVALFFLWVFHPKWLQSDILYLYKKFGSMPEYSDAILSPSDRTCYNLLDKYVPYCVTNTTHTSYYDLDKEPVSAYLCKELSKSIMDEFPGKIFDDIVDIATNATESEESVRESVLFYMGKYIKNKFEETYPANINGTEVKITFQEIAANWMAELLNRNTEGTEIIRGLLRKIPQKTNKQ